MNIIRPSSLLVACCASIVAHATTYPFDHAQLQVDIGNGLSADQKPTWLIVEKGVNLRMETDDHSGAKNAMIGFGNFAGRSGLIFRIDSMGSVCVADLGRDARAAVIGPTPTTFTLSNFRKQGAGGPCTTAGGAVRTWEGEVTLATTGPTGQLAMDVKLVASAERSKTYAYRAQNVALAQNAAPADDGSAARQRAPSSGSPSQVASVPNQPQADPQSMESQVLAVLPEQVRVFLGGELVPGSLKLGPPTRQNVGDGPGAVKYVVRMTGTYAYRTPGNGQDAHQGVWVEVGPDRQVTCVNPRLASSNPGCLPVSASTRTLLSTKAANDKEDAAFAAGYEGRVKAMQRERTLTGIALNQRDAICLSSREEVSDREQERCVAYAPGSLRIGMNGCVQRETVHDRSTSWIVSNTCSRPITFNTVCDGKWMRQDSLRPGGQEYLGKPDSGCSFQEPSR